MKKFLLFFLFGCLGRLDSFGQQPAHFRIVGYYYLQAAMTADTAKFPWDELTHINLAFLNPDADGHLSQDLSQLASFVQAAHHHRVAVLVSIAGGSPHPYYHAILKDQQRDLFINQLLDLVLKNDLDGIDVDIEGDDLDGNYGRFVRGLVKAFHPHHKLVTAAIATFYKNKLTDDALAQFDFMNVMSYDHTGPWTPSKPGPHSTYEQAISDLDYFRLERKIPKEKLVLGVGFYGYGFGPELSSPAMDMSYADIVAKYPNAKDSDQVTLPAGYTMYYNGMPTIKKKVLLAKQHASGIMIWQLLGDAPGDQSLLKLIHAEAAK